MSPVGRPKGCWTENSMRHRIRLLLQQGRALSMQEIVAHLGEDPKRIKNALTCGVRDRAFKSIHVCGEAARYTLRDYEFEFPIVPSHRIPDGEGHREWWQV